MKPLKGTCVHCGRTNQEVQENNEGFTVCVYSNYNECVAAAEAKYGPGGEL